MKATTSELHPLAGYVDCHECGEPATTINYLGLDFCEAHTIRSAAGFRYHECYHCSQPITLAGRIVWDDEMPYHPDCYEAAVWSKADR